MALVKTHLRSTLFFALLVVGVLFYASLIMATWPWSRLPLRQGLARSWSRYNRRILAATCHLDDEIIGLDLLPKTPCIILSRHQSAWETLVYQAIFPGIIFAVKKELMLIPFFGWALKATGQIAVDRDRGVEALRRMRKDGEQRLGEGNSIVIFPEGTRTPPGAMGPFNPGGIGLALSAQVPIVPVAHNAGLFWRRRAFTKYPGTIRLRVGPPIPTQGLTGADRKKLQDQVRQSILAMMAEIGLPESPGNKTEG
ncbi:MAG: 1-acyl-sn-glycerol-3-phosphate acyltransferase [Magnetococcales bacterium]|nr:1-acyl-sn-glycerol-3-phosphate acyltransferase [Magnetococcales bacterium]MBF0157609.1 1-acyl-sn-glycerol-3-phosphate acyltransferase [Magnetococcales bacterium]